MTGRLLRAELLRVSTTRVLAAVVALMAIALILAVVILTLVHGTGVFHGQRTFTHRAALREVLSLAGRMGGLVALGLGAGAVVGPRLRGAEGYDVLAAPGRWPVVLSRVAAYVLVGLAVGVAAVVVTYAAATVVLQIQGVGFGLTRQLPVAVAAGSVLSCALMGGIGAALAEVTGARLSLTAAVVLILVAVQLTGVIDAIDRYLPGGAVAALTREQISSTPSLAIGGVLLLLYMTATALLGALVLRRRDLG